ncbi:hypothetical protein Hanom_Chr13g01195391 [Helianthus anomalus]
MTLCNSRFEHLFLIISLLHVNQQTLNLQFHYLSLLNHQQTPKVASVHHF